MASELAAIFYCFNTEYKVMASELAAFFIVLILNTKSWFLN